MRAIIPCLQSSKSTYSKVNLSSPVFTTKNSLFSELRIQREWQSCSSIPFWCFVHLRLIAVTLKQRLSSKKNALTLNGLHGVVFRTSGLMIRLNYGTRILQFYTKSLLRITQCGLSKNLKKVSVESTSTSYRYWERTILIYTSRAMNIFAHFLT